MKFYTRKIYKGGRKPRIIETDLSESEAQQRVQADMKINSKAETYMLVYNKQKGQQYLINLQEEVPSVNPSGEPCTMGSPGMTDDEKKATKDKADSGDIKGAVQDVLDSWSNLNN